MFNEPCRNQFRLCERNIKQLVEALTCPVNRYATMVEHSCNEMELFHHPDWLVMHYVENGGAIAFAEKRSNVRPVSLPQDENEDTVISSPS